MSNVIRPYLVQRAIVKEPSAGVKGLDAILQFDYMGSAEFEFGALPASLTKIRENNSEYELFSLRVHGLKDRIVSVYCKVSDREGVIDAINKLADNEFHLKEYSGFDRWFKGNKSTWQSNFWWDIDNDFMFWSTGDGQFDKNFLARI